MKRERFMRRLWALSALACLTAWLAGCGGWTAPRPVHMEVVSANATSQTSILVTFSAAVGEGADNKENYVLSAPDGSRLQVLAAYRMPGGTSVTLATKPQKAVAYALTIKNIKAAANGSPAGELKLAGGISGSTIKGPVVASAIAIDNTHVLITFLDPNSGHAAEVGPGAENPGNYEIGDRLLQVTNARLGNDRTTVTLTTSAQDDIDYSVKVTNVYSAHGDMLVEPSNRSSFHGIAVDDGTGPSVTSAVATSNTTVLVTFSEPVRDSAADTSLYAIATTDGTAPLAVTGADLMPFNTQITLTTMSQAAGESYTLTVKDLRDKSGNLLNPNPDQATFEGISRLGPPNADTEAPRVRSAVSISNDSVIVTFSEPVQGGEGSAENAAHYSIFARVLDDASAGTIDTQSTVLVLSAVLSPTDPTKVTLKTMPQSEMIYTLTVADVQDLAGNQVMPPDRDHPYSVTFLGTGTSGPRADSDGDGLSDAGEQAGWIVTVRKSNGELGRSEVTSDPGLADTDADGMSDLDELIYLINPRSPDTDGDGLTDYQELNFIYSDPTGQDSDEDGLQDGLEYNFFKTSPILADTDGDQLPDGNEATSGNRNPLIADLPRISIAVGDVNLELDERYSYTDTEGQSQEVSSSTSTTLEQGTERTYSTSDTSTLSSALKFSQEVKGTYEFPKTFGVEVSAGFEQSSAEEYTTNVSQESAQRSSTAYNESVAKTNSFQSSSEVSREVMGASMKLSLDLGSISDVAFSVSNLEVTALWQDPVDPTRLVPIATLVPSAQLTGGTPTYNLGPFVPTKGPVMFENREVFPKTVEQLLKSPRGLVFKVANYDILAEDGRNFAFSSQETYDRTVGITIDYGGDGRAVERYRVATDTGSIVPFYDSNEDGTLALHCGAGDSCDNNGDGTVDAGDRIVFDANGDPVGITMADALALLGVEYKQDTTDTETNRRVLTELNGVANDAGNHQAWVTFYSTAVDPSMQHRSVLIREADFDDVVLHAGDTYILAYSQDKDEDKLFAREEYLYGSSDDWDNSDDNGGSDDDTCPTGEGYGFSYFQDDPSATLPLDHPSFTCDTLSDFEEVRDGWTVAIRGETEYKAYSSPRLADSDSDGLVDHDEQTLGTDPRKRDTDEDGITDFDEVYGFKIRFRGDLKFSDLTDKFCTALITGGTCTSTEDYVTNPLDPDTDGDGIEDGFEIGMGANPQNADAEDFIDTDQDGLADSVEDEGWTITVNGVETSVFSSKYEPDTDGDGLPDLLENMVGSNPLDATTDGNEDGLSDYQELNIQTYATKIDRSFDLNKFLNTCGSSLYNATRCVYDAANSPAYGTDPSNSDSDHDGLNDDFELFDSWNIKVAGQDAYAATLDPVEANADDDGWDDGEEYRNGTDPNLASTDGDAKDDDDEASKCAGGECQDPLVPDQLITVTYTQITFKNGCEGSAEIDDEGEFFWVLNLVRPDGTTIRVDDGENYGVDEEEAPKVKSLAGEAPSQQFVKAYSESFRLTGNIYESDAAPNDDDCVGSWDTAYPGELTKTSDSFSEGSDWTVDVSLKVD